MEIAILIGILLVAWYYGASIKSTVERSNAIVIQANEQRTDSQIASFGELERGLSDINESINYISHKIDDVSHSFGVEWKFADKNKFSPILKKLDELSFLSYELNSLSDQLGNISDSVDVIVAHPAFTRTPDEYL
jgi:methyl-accepting chemotaxis protein